LATERVLVLLLAGCGATHAAPQHTTPARCDLDECDGIRWSVTVPDACPPSGCGLVIDVHGLTMNAQMEDANTHLRALGRQYGYVVVQPNANPPPKEWSFDFPRPWPVWIPQRDDAPVFHFVQHAIEALHVDRSRVHMTGFSLGGMMTWRLLCDHADLFASVAPASGTAGCFEGRTPSREIPVLYLHGTRDVLVPFHAAKQRRAALVTAWSLHEVARDALDARTRRTTYVSKLGTAVVFVEHDHAAKMRVELGGHCFPGSDDPGDAPGQLYSFACEDPAAFRWGELVMDFFRAHPRRV
jgi:poly(3-hydroxybutyrate) depolymerase